MADIYGTAGSDTLAGNVGNDNIFGFSQAGGPGSDSGNDQLSGLGGKRCAFRRRRQRRAGRRGRA